MTRVRHKLIQDKDHLAELAVHLSSCSTIALDTEFVREKTYLPQLGLIQIADRDDAWIVDPLALDVEAMAPLLEIFVNPNILKVIHSAEQDQICLYHGYGIVANPLFDTAIGAALCGFGDQVGLSNLLKKTLDVDLPKSHTRANWVLRPLPKTMMAYALSDVDHLVEAAEVLMLKLDSRERRQWAFELSARWVDLDRYASEVLTISERLVGKHTFTPRSYAVLCHLVQWREDCARAKNIPRKWIADDQVLAKLASVAPRKEEELTHFRGLKVKSDSHTAVELLTAVQRALDIPEEELVKPPIRLEPRPHEGPAMSVLRCFINLLAHEQGVAPRFLADGDTLLKLLRSEFSHVEELKQAALLPVAVVDQIGKDLVGVLNGQIGLRLEQGQAQRCTCEQHKL
ncbi:MAG: hypothetical protein CMN58_05735 [Solibacterales bacterium]|nr:hypothetical protein [Bryobacterales bacterium]|tara:strand:- start:30324 stop:31523 length:1200 start_codon:yes stop_codon:yes gene_type:complete